MFKPRDDSGVTSRFLLEDLPEGVEQPHLVNYFGIFGTVEEVTIKELAAGRRMGSVKFTDPTKDLKGTMLNGQHEIGGFPLKIITWKMQKVQKPGYQAKVAAEVAARHAAKGQHFGGMCGWGGGELQAWPSSGKGAAMMGYGGGADAYEASGAALAAAAHLGMQAALGFDGMGGWGGGGQWSGFEAGGGFGAGGKGCMAGKGVLVPARRSSPYGAGCGGKAGPVCGYGKGAVGGYGKGYGKTDAPAARYLLSDLPITTSQEALMTYFSAYGELLEVTCRTLASGKIVGSVKFQNPTMDLRRRLLSETHEIDGQQVKVETWKMQKTSRPGLKQSSDGMGGQANAFATGAEQSLDSFAG